MTPKRHRSGEAGSAYIIVLLCLVVLTILALSLAFLTQTEVQIGANERTVNRAFYGAESGIGMSLAGAMTNNDYLTHTYTFTDPGAVTGLGLKETVTVSPVVPILDAPCNLCEINGAGSYGTRSYRTVTFALTATSTRTTTLSSNPLGQKTLSLMILSTPAQVPNEAYSSIDDPAQLAMIKF